MPHRIRCWAAALIAALSLTAFFVFSRPALGYTVFFVSGVAIYFVLFGLPKRRRAQSWAIIALVVGLALPFALFNNATLRFLDTIACFFLVVLLFVLQLLKQEEDWDRPQGVFELFLGIFARPFIRLGAPWKRDAPPTASTAATPDQAPAAADAPPIAPASKAAAVAVTSKRPDRPNVLAQVVIALVIAIPVIGFLLVFLASSDKVFGSYVSDTISSLFSSQFILQAFVFIVAVPFSASTMWSYAERKRLFPQKLDASGRPTGSTKRPMAPSISAIVIIGLIDLLYLAYALVQFVYLFGGVVGHLPADMTYAEYARSGFFELAFVSAVNVVFIFLSITFTPREGKQGTILRLLSVVLIALAGVQLVSAFTRMSLYVQAFGFTELRLFVTIFMVFIAVVFAIMLLREFFFKVPVFKSVVYAACVLLLLTNFLVPDAFIARYNIDHYLSGSLKRLDTSYLFDQLSYDAEIVAFQNEAALKRKDPSLTKKFETYRARLDGSDRSDPYELSMFQFYGYPQTGTGSKTPAEVLDASWKNYNLNMSRITGYE